MRRVLLLILLLLVLPSASFAGPGALKWIEGSGYSQHSTKSGSTSLLKEITNNSNKKSLLYQVANDTNNLAKKAVKAAGTGSKIGVAGATAKKLAKGGGLGWYGAAGTLVLHLGASYLKDHWEDYPLLKEILCQTLGMCPSEDIDDPLHLPLTYNHPTCGFGQLVSQSEGYAGCNTELPSGYTYCSQGYIYIRKYFQDGMCIDYSQRLSTYVKDAVYKVVSEDDIPKPIYPDELTPEQEESLSERILQELEKENETSEQLAEELDRLIKDNPDDLLWDPLDNEEVKDNLYQDESDKLQQQKDEIEQKLNDDPDNADLKKQLEDLERQIDELDSKRNKEILDEEQKKQEEEEKKEEEKIDPIGREEWEPYDPGPFNIPKRFNDMLNTVKGTALFSFSRGFFESLPSGGSPIVTFEGGNTFGNHTIDLSDTMQVGLVAFRAVVMVIFGFLAIRAVIMKR